MTPVLFQPGPISHASNGIGRLTDAVRCEVTEVRNGSYELELDYPITGVHFYDLKRDYVIYVTHDETKVPQPFALYARSAPIDGMVTFYAHHISYDLDRITVMPFTAASCAEALTSIKSHAANSCNFVFETDITSTASMTVSVPTYARKALGGMQGSVLDTYGGEYEWDDRTVHLWASRGRDTGYQIRYGKNLLDIKQDIDTSQTYNSVTPYWFKEVDGVDTLVVLPEMAIDADGTFGDRGHILNLTEKFETQPTVEQLRAEARKSLPSSGTTAPNETIELDFIQLWQTDEYKHIGYELQTMRLCDTVDVYYTRLDIEAPGVKIVKTVYDSLRDIYIGMTLGELKTTLNELISR